MGAPSRPLPRSFYAMPSQAKRMVRDALDALDAFDVLDVLDVDSYRALAGVGVGYGLILTAIFVLLFVLPYLLVTAL